jgi:outer membrane biosynthesis protein TonB
MMEQGATSLLRRIGIPAVLLCLAFAAPTQAATPSPDAPPLGVAPEAPQSEPAPVAPARSAPAVTPTVVTQPPVVVRTVETPVYVVREAPAQQAPVTKAPARTKPVAKATPTPKPKPKTKARQPEAVAKAPPHDRNPVPLAALIPTVEELDRGLVALAGAGLAFVALGGAVMLAAARRQLGVAR